MSAKDYQENSALNIFLHYFKPHKKYFIIDMVCAFIIALVDLAYPFISRIAMNSWLPDNKYTIFFVVIGIVIAAYVIRSLLYYVVTVVGHTFGIRVEADMREDLFAHIQSLSFKYFDNNRTGILMSRITNDLFEVVELAHHAPEDIFISCITLVGALIVMYTIQWKLALLLTIIIPLLIIFVMSNRQRQLDTSVEVKRRTAKINAVIESSLSGIRTSKAYANEDIEYKKFCEANQGYKVHKKEFYKAMGIFHGGLEFVCCSLSVAVMGFGGYLIMTDQLTYADLVTFMLYITTFINPIRRMGALAETLSTGTAGLSRFIEIMSTDADIKDKEDAKELIVAKGNVSLKDVHFSYNDNVEILHGISFDINGGETLAVVGSSGGGKTTLCQLLPRFYDISSGVILIDGQNVKDVTQDSLHKAIGIVQQDVFLFAGTIRENIAYGKLEASDEEIIAAAKKAEIYDDILAMPNGLDTYVGERGVMLSGGQKQRVSIARIFLKDPPILILDEATSALDTVTESKIQSAFDELAKGRTTIIIAHRLSTIRKAKRIIVIENGRIQESGTHKELEDNKGLFAQLLKYSRGENDAIAE